METKRAKAFAVMGGVGIAVVLAMHLLLTVLGTSGMGPAWFALYAPWIVFLFIGAVGLKPRGRDAA